ncbi:hypothetical protein C9Z24_26275 [Escherichia coli]|nr:hypothetical protein [Escherichia coli]EFI3478085.1 hypothetical protein [Escherichia coli]EFI3881638.1 hypothetical protein [Escherichia coli]EFI4271455.1 hypothetical protein [Escherichia coli]EFI4363988.1 hypothetical protein [Escherichia coli]
MAIVGKNSEINRYSGVLDKVKIFIFRSCNKIDIREKTYCLNLAEIVIRNECPRQISMFCHARNWLGGSRHQDLASC